MSNLKFRAQPNILTTNQAISSLLSVLASGNLKAQSQECHTEPVATNPKYSKSIWQRKHYANYAKYQDEFVTYLKTNGVDLYAISLQN